MASKSSVWGIDVGQCSLKAVKLQAVGDQVEMLAFDVVEHPLILSQAESDVASMIDKALDTFVGRNDLKGSKVVIAVPGQQTLTRFTKMPPVEPKKIPDMVQYEASQQIPFDMDEVVWDYQVFTEKESPDVEVGIFAIRKELIRNYLSHFLDRGIEPFVVQSSPMASYNAARFEQLGEAGHAYILLDMGALATDLIVCEGNRIWSRPVPIGGNRFTESLVSAFKIAFAKAEKLKRHAATSKYARQVFNAMRPVFADLVSEVQRSIGFYTSTHRDAHITRVIGMGNAFKLPGLQKFLNQNLQLEVEKISGFKNINTSVAENSQAYMDNVMSFSVAVGAAIQGLGKASVESNLLPVEIRKTLLWGKKRPWFAASAACLAIGGGAMWVGNVMANSQIKTSMGNLQSIATVPVNSVDDAERKINGLGGEAPLEKAAIVAGAAAKLQSALADTETKVTKEKGLMASLAKLPQNNVIIPRIIECVHQAFASAQLPEQAKATGPREFMELAKKLPRKERRDMWIDKFDTIYVSSDPSAVFPDLKDEKFPHGKAGWAIRLTGGTSDPQPAKWLEEQLVKGLEKAGRRPDRGFYFPIVKLTKVATLPRQAEGPGFDEPKLGDGGGGRGNSGGGRGGRGNVGGTGGDLKLGGGGGGPRGGGRGGGGSDSDAGPGASGGNIGDEVFRLKQKFAKEDPLTNEPRGEDQLFIIEIVALRENTPAAMLPDEFKPKKDQKAAAKPPAPKAGGK